tara:strand:- start:1544 stop:1681 length:138 start_codon:yes stop_codon:yes gene_type:complete
MKHLHQYVKAQIAAHGKPVRKPNRQLEIGKANLKQIKITKIVNKF